MVFGINFPTSNISSCYLIDNLIGSFGLGHYGWFSMGHASKETVHLLGIGLLGSFTTMSAYAYKQLRSATLPIPLMAMYVA